MNKYRLTIERADGTWGQYDFEAGDMGWAARWVSRNVDLNETDKLHIVNMETLT